MLEQSPVLIRMRDVLIALGSARLYSQSLGLAQLQRFVYLVDVLGPLYDVQPLHNGYLTYSRGPYDLTIQSAIDALAFRGFAAIGGVQVGQQTFDEVHYYLLPSGQSLLDRLVGHHALEPRWLLAQEVSKRIDALGWDRLIGLAKAEPTFTGTIPRGYGQQLIPTDGLKNSAAFLMATLDHALRYGYNAERVNRSLMFDLFFRYLDDYDKAYRALVFVDEGSHEVDSGRRNSESLLA